MWPTPNNLSLWIKCVQGWLSPSYGHVISNVMNNPYAGLEIDVLATRREDVLREIREIERDFVSDTKLFIQQFIDPISLRNTHFKRQFLSQISVAVTLQLYQNISIASSNFLRGFDAAIESSNTEALAESYIQLSPSLQLFAQYAMENASCLDTLKMFNRELREMGIEIESFLILPLQHYAKYASMFQELVWLTPESVDGKNSLIEALHALISQKELVDQALIESSQSLKLLALQTKCTAFCL